MKESVTPANFRNKKGLKLFGMLHTPSDSKRDVGIIILNPGIKNRIAPHRLYVKMSQHFCELGFNVLRFDPEGIGDSEGEIDERFAADFYGTVQVGRFIDDTICAMDWMEHKLNVRRFILTGLCGGAITGLLTGAQDNRVDSLIGLGMPVILDGSNVNHFKYITEGQLRRVREGYLKKVKTIRAWFRFLTLRSDYRTILKSLLLTLRRNAHNDKKRLYRNQHTVDKDLSKQNANFNPHFPSSFSRLISTRKMLLIFSENDRLYWEFDEKFMKHYQTSFRKYMSNLEIYISKEANHIFSFSEWQEDMLSVSSSWLNKNYNLEYSKK